ncbi:MAG TPA: DUF4118 domain-containing protein [Patescibacteria group bacterium]|nr:DUF4118 domain-containing protein [Patescibacteria group bacterium]
MRRTDHRSPLLPDGLLGPLRGHLGMTSRGALLPDAWQLRYGLAFVAVGLAWASRELLLAPAGDGSPFLVFGLAVLITALVGGFGPGLLATILASVVAVLFYLSPRLALAVHSPLDVVELGLFELEGLVAATAGEAIRRAVAREKKLGTQLRHSSYLHDATLLRGRNPDGVKPPVEQLTEREIEIVRLVALGLGNGEIAGRLFVTHNTVKTHLQGVYGKLGVHTRTEATVRCIELGLLGPSPPPETGVAPLGVEPRWDEPRRDEALLPAIRRVAG